MEKHEAERIAGAVNHLRPEWPTAQILTLIRERLAGRAARDVALALTWIAHDPASKSPYRVLEAGPWWRAIGGGDEQTGIRHPRRGEQCHICQRWTDACICQDDTGRRTGPTLRPPASSPPPPDLLAATRQQIRANRPDPRKPRGSSHSEES